MTINLKRAFFKLRQINSPNEFFQFSYCHWSVHTSFQISNFGWNLLMEFIEAVTFFAPSLIMYRITQPVIQSEMAAFQIIPNLERAYFSKIWTFRSMTLVVLFEGDDLPIFITYIAGENCYSHFLPLVISSKYVIF